MPELQDSLACLETLIGLSQNDCVCIEDGRPDDYNESLSGLYMDDYEHGLSYIFPKSAKDCGDNDVWTVLAKARYEGLNDFITHLFMAIGKNKNTFVDGFSGEFGEVNKRTVNTADKSCKKTNVGFTFTPGVYQGAQVKIKKIWLAIDTAGTYDIKIYDVADMSTIIDTFPIVHTGGNTLIGVDVGELYQLSEAGKPISYAITYERGAGYPLNFTYHCGCGYNRKPMWMKNSYMSADGFCVNDLEDVVIGDSCCNRKYTGGLIVEWEMVCDPTAWICQQDDSFWKSTQWGRVASKAAQLITTIKVIGAVLSTGRVNFYTMIAADELMQRREAFNKLSMELIEYLSDNMPEHVKHCWRCESTMGFSKRSIRV